MQDKITAPKERIAKRIARAGLASRRQAESMITEGRVSLNGVLVKTPALSVAPSDVIAVDGKDLTAPVRTRLWLYHKPKGLVTSHRDEKGRKTVFETLPAELGRVVSVGRLDMDSEGLLLLTNDGELKRHLELPSTGWLRRYRVRACGRIHPKMLEKLAKGISTDEMRYRPMQVRLDDTDKKGANRWFTVGIREGKNREIRRAFKAIGLEVNRLIRISYGPFKLDKLACGAHKHVPLRVLKDQLGQYLAP